jgi:hypothetical protein
VGDTRRRFAATFVALRFDAPAPGRFGERRLERRRCIDEAVHRLRAVAGTIGFPTVSTRASDLEHFVRGADPVDAVRACAMVDAVENAFATDVAERDA